MSESIDAIKNIATIVIDMTEDSVILFLTI